MKQKKKIKKRKPLSTETRKKISEALRARKKKDAPIVEPVLKSQEHTDELLEKYKDLTRQEIIKLQRIREHRQSNGSEYFKPFDYQENFLDYIVAGKKVALIQGANQIGKCVTSQTLIDTPSGELLMGKLFEKNKPFDVYAWDGNKKVIAKASTPFKKEGLHKCYRITMSDDRWVEAADYHRVFCSDGSWQTVQSLYESFQHHRESTLGICPSNPALNVKRSFEKRSNYPGDYSAGFHQYGEQPHFVQDNGQVSFPSQDDVRKHNVLEFREDVRGSRYINTALPSFFPLSNLDVLRHFWVRFVETLFRIFDNILSPFSLGCQLSPILSTVVISGLPQGFLIDQFVPQKKFSFSDSLAYCPPLSDGNKIISITPISPCQEVYDFEVEKYHNYFAGGLIHHNTLIGSILIDTFANCRQAFDWKDKALEKVFENRPVRIRIIASDWEHHANEVIVPKLKEVITAGTYTTRKNNVGVEAFWQFKTGSTIELMTHSQETKLHEGWTGDVVWSDEPLPQDKFVANRRGLIAHSGLFFMTMTAISEPWIMDEIVLSNKKHIGCVTNIP
ncbi:MAG: hypothetical protein KKE05_04400, partial [Nanoarchaeota archaeon]|nr:hypothetical protein [Nanoarchaeota archaeon]